MRSAVTPAANADGGAVRAEQDRERPGGQAGAARCRPASPARPRGVQRMARSLTCRSTVSSAAAAGRADEHAQLDAGGEIVSGGNGEMEAGAVFDAGRNRDVYLVVQQLDPAAGTSRAGLRSTFRRDRRTRGTCTVRARRAGPSHLRSLRAAKSRSRRSASSACSSARNALRIRSIAGATDGKSIDDLIGEPPAIVTELSPPRTAIASPPKRPKRVPGHRTAVTIGAGQGEVNGPKRVSDVRRDDAAARTRDDRSRTRHDADQDLEIP